MKAIIIRSIKMINENIYNTISGENKKIISTIDQLEKDMHTSKKYYDNYRGNGAYLNGYVIKRDTWCWLVWKRTKKLPLLKIVPLYTRREHMSRVLNSQPWTDL